jgi:Ca2+-binding EF-hand superfamily protein
MKLTKTQSLLLACSLALLSPSLALAGDVDKKMDKLDTNDDGQISRAEHSAGMQRMFTKMDTNNDGAVTLAELEAKKDAKHDVKGRDDGNRREMEPDHGMTAAEKFAKLDQNGDGRVTAAEHTSACDGMFDKIDTNHDGSLTEAEMDAHKESMMKHKHD